MKKDIKIDLPKGQELHIRATEDFMKKVKEHFSI